MLTLDQVWLVALSRIQGPDVFVARAALNSRSRDLVAVEMKDRKDSPIAHRVQEGDGLPASFERAGFRFSISTVASFSVSANGS